MGFELSMGLGYVSEYILATGIKHLGNFSFSLRGYQHGHFFWARTSYESLFIKSTLQIICNCRSNRVDLNAEV